MFAALLLVGPSAWAASMSGTVKSNTSLFSNDLVISPVSGATVYLDLNDSRTQDEGDLSVQTGADGTFSFTGVDPGDYRVRLAPRSGYSCAGWSGGCWTDRIHLDSSTDAADLLLTQFQRTATASGSLFVDSNQDGVLGRREKAGSGLTVFQDLNLNQIPDPGEPQTVSNGAGAWSMSVAPGRSPIGVAGTNTIYSQGTPRLFGGLSGVASMDSNGMNSCALLSNQTLKCWGANNSGQLGNGTIASAGSDEIVTWEPQSVLGISDAVQVSVGGEFACALRAGGGVKCWGRDAMGQLGDGATTDNATPQDVLGISNATQVSAGGETACARLSTGAVKCWGSDGNGVATGDASGDSDPHSTPTLIPGISTAQSVVVGSTAACAILTGGSVQCWGSGSLAGNGDDSHLYPPTTISGLGGVQTVVISGSNVCALLSGGGVRCWGSGGYNGDGTDIQRALPVDVAGISGATKLMANKNGTSFCASGSGGIKCWGELGSGQPGRVSYAALANTDFSPSNVSFNQIARSPIQAVDPGSSEGLDLGFSLCGINAGLVRCQGFWIDFLYAFRGSAFSPGSPVNLGSIPLAPKTVATPQITAAPASMTTATSGQIRTTLPPGMGSACRIDDGEWRGPGIDGANCAALSYSNLTNGEHTFQVVSFDTSTGWVFSNPASYTWTVRTGTPLPPSIDARPAASTKSNAAIIIFSGMAGSTFSCNIDSGGWSACSSPLYLQDLSQGAHSVQIKQTNDLGLQSSAETVSWTQEALDPLRTTVLFGNDTLSCSNNVTLPKGQVKRFSWLAAGTVQGDRSSLKLSDGSWGRSTLCLVWTLVGSTTTTYPAAAWNQPLPNPVMLGGLQVRRPNKKVPVVSCAVGRWKYGPISYSYQWKRNGENIAGATNSSYGLVGADNNKTITCQVTATNTTGSTTSSASLVVAL